MRPEQLSDALNYLEEDLIAEAAAVRDHSKARRPSWQKWGALAACLAVAVFAGTRLLPGEALPKPGNPPRPGASGPSQPVQGGELPTLTIQWDTSGGMGFEGYMAFDIAELGGNNPWTEEAELSTLPVYKNPLTYDEQHRATGANWRRMKALLLDVAGKLGLDTQNLPITDNTPSQEQQQAIREKFAAVGDTVPEGYFDPTTLIIEGEGVTVEVDQTLTARIDFDPPVALPEGYNFTHFHQRLGEAEGVHVSYPVVYAALTLPPAPRTARPPIGFPPSIMVSFPAWPSPLWTRGWGTGTSIRSRALTPSFTMEWGRWRSRS